MRTLLFLLQKEFLQVFRNKTMLPIIFVMPVLQLLVLANAATFELKNIDLAIVDHDQSYLSAELKSHFSASPFYTIVANEVSVSKSLDMVHADKADAILVIANGFEKEFLRGQQTELQLLINAIDGSAAGLMNSYTGQIIQSFLQEQMAINTNIAIPRIVTQERFWYNPELTYSHFMIPGILVILVTVIGMFLTALNIVREKEMGTMEQINVTPIKKYQFILGKLIPFWVIAMFELMFGLMLAKLVFDIPLNGSLLLVFSVAGVFLVVALAMGLFLSSVAESQQQVMFLAYFFMIVFILMSGIFTPTDSMPLWAQIVDLINPIFYFMKVMRMVLIKGSGFTHILPYLLGLMVLSVLMLTLAIAKYRKTT